MNSMSWQQTQSDLPFAHGGPLLSGIIKQQPADFIVEEQLGFQPDGDGEHEMLFVEKTGLNTVDVQRQLAKAYRMPVQRVSYAGLKDRQGITRQWFSVHAGIKSAEPYLDELAAGVRVLQRARNRRKLQRGSHRGNAFVITVRDCSDKSGADAVTQRLQALREQGVPNYFGQQRFGWDANNLQQVARWFADPTQAPASRVQRGLLLSSARSLIFNAVLAARVTDGSWNRILPGEVVALTGSGSTFASSRATADELQQRLQSFDIHPTGPLWGTGDPATSDAVAALEIAIAGSYREFTAGLQQHGLQHERRALRLQVSGLEIEHQDRVIRLSFTLTRGAYATAVLRELVATELM
jgi:tRNA pseudouridine13 synthase